MVFIQVMLGVKGAGGNIAHHWHANPLGRHWLDPYMPHQAEDNIQGEVLGTQVSLRVLGDAIICLLGGLLLLISPKIILGVAAAISSFALSFYFLKRNLFT